MRRIALLVAAAGALALPAQAATRTVYVTDDGYSTNYLKVKKGTKIVWRFDARRGHNVTVDTGPTYFASPTQSFGTFTRTLARRGTYVLYCSIHNFEMTVRVVR